MQLQKWIVVITGQPATGKSALAELLRTRFGWPLLAKDDLKETLFDALGIGDRSWSRRLSEASFALLFRLAGDVVRHAAVSVLEGNFRTRDHFERLGTVADGSRARLLVVELCASREVIQERLQARATMDNRHPGHLDRELAGELHGTRAPPSRPADQWMQAAHWLRYDTDTLDDAVIERIASGIAARVAP
jgi:predicted kinase